MTQNFNSLVNTVEEGIISKAIGTAAVAGALNFGTPAEATPASKAPSSETQISKQKIQHNIIARTLWAEARNNGEKGMRAVASVIYNRGNGNTDAMIKVIKAPKQFSCWNRMSLKDWLSFKLKRRSGKEWDTASQIAYEMINGTFKPVTIATHYYNPAKVSPEWAYINNKIRPHLAIGDHVFMRI